MLLLLCYFCYFAILDTPYMLLLLCYFCYFGYFIHDAAIVLFLLFWILHT